MRHLTFFLILFTGPLIASPFVYTEATAGFVSLPPLPECPNSGTTVGTTYAYREMLPCAPNTPGIPYGFYERGEAKAEAKATYGKLQVYAFAYLINPEANAIARFSDEITIFGVPSGILNLTFHTTGWIEATTGEAHSTLGDLYFGASPYANSSLGFDESRILQIPFTEGVPVSLSSEIFVYALAVQVGAEGQLTETLTITAYSNDELLRGLRYTTASRAAYRFPSAIPEPSTTALAGLGVLALAVRLRRKPTPPPTPNQ